MLIVPMISRLRNARDLKQVLHVALADVVALHGAERGNVQLLDAAGRLVIVAQLGFSHEFLSVFRAVELHEGSVCARAAKEKRIVFVQDVEKDPEFSPYLQLARKIPFRAVLSAPLVTTDGRFIGMISAHSANLFQPTPLELDALKRYCTELADAVWTHLRLTDRHEVAESLSAEVFAAAAYSLASR
jgi:GAF domain-containing protein